jgi:hypothetical protein
MELKIQSPFQFHEEVMDLELCRGEVNKDSDTSWNFSDQCTISELALFCLAHSLFSRPEHIFSSFFVFVIHRLVGEYRKGYTRKSSITIFVLEKPLLAMLSQLEKFEFHSPNPLPDSFHLGLENLNW